MADRHGLTGYKKKGCRCDICRAANAAYSRERPYRGGYVR